MIRAGGLRATPLLAALLASALACTVDIDTAREGFPCNADGSCRNGLVCRDGVCVREPEPSCTADCELPTGTIALVATPSTILADGMSTAAIQSDVVRTRAGDPVPDGTLFEVETSRGTLQVAGQDVGRVATVTARDGRIAFLLRAAATPGTATVTATSIDGDASGWVEVILRDAGSSGALQLTAEPALVPADGKTHVTVTTATVLDPDGSPIPDGTLATVWTSLGTVVTADADPSTYGRQIAAVGGRFVVEIQAGTQAATASVTLEVPSLGLLGSTTFEQGPSVAVVTPFEAIVADGVSTGTVDLYLMDDDGNPVPGATFDLALSLGMASRPTDSGNGTYPFSAWSEEVGEAEVRVVFSTYTLLAEGTISFVAPSLTVNLSAEATDLLPLDTVALRADVAGAADPAAVTFEWQVSSGPARGVFLQYGGPTASGPEATFFAGEAGTYDIDVTATDGSTIGNARLTITVHPFTQVISFSARPIASGLDPVRGDIVVLDTQGRVLLLSGTSPYVRECVTGEHALRGDVVADGNGGFFVGAEGKLFRDPVTNFDSPLGHVARQDPGCAVTILDSGSAGEISSMALRANGDLWISSEEGLQVLPEGASSIDPTQEYLFNMGSGRGALSWALAFDAYDYLFVAGAFDGYWRTSMPFDRTSPWLDYTPDNDRIRAIVPGAGGSPGLGGTQEIFLLADNLDAIGRIPDTHEPSANLEAYRFDYFGRPLGSVVDGVFEAGTGSLWAASGQGLVRFPSALGFALKLEAGEAGLCPQVRTVEVDEDPGRGRTIYVICDDGLYAAFVP